MCWLLVYRRTSGPPRAVGPLFLSVFSFCFACLPAGGPLAFPCPSLFFLVVAQGCMLTAKYPSYDVTHVSPGSWGIITGWTSCPPGFRYKIACVIYFYIYIYISLLIPEGPPAFAQFGRPYWVFCAICVSKSNMCCTFVESLRFFVTFGHQDVSRTLALDRTENISFGEKQKQNDDTNIGKVHLNIFLTLPNV